jgi:hypothetical protein
MNLESFKDIKMCGTVLKIRGFDSTLTKYEYENACCVEFHITMFNKNRKNTGLLKDL